MTQPTEIRGYDTSAAFRDDCLERIKWLADKIAESQRMIEKVKNELSEREKRIRRLKKEMACSALKI